MAVRPEELSTFDPYLQLPGIANTDEVFLKVEHLNPTGSVKLKAARYLINDAEKRYTDLTGKVIVESSSGNLGIALAMICASRGYRFRCVVDPNTNRQAIAEMIAYGAEIHEVTERDTNGGFLGTRIAVINDWTAGDPDVIWLNQYQNPSNPVAHMALTGPELAAAFHRIDYLFVGVGTGGTIRGIVDYFGSLGSSTTIVAVDTAGSVTFGGTAGPRFIPGIGASRVPAHVDGLAVDHIELVDERCAVRECHLLARAYGLLAGGSTGSVVAAIRRYAATFEQSDVVVGISADSGHRYLSTIFNPQWVEATYGALSTPTIDKEGTGRTR
ncbi:2,3-diaminopropionate biosynthesis protein SbnA [Nocardia sp. NPDC051570]|uniref:2,3-diaminopropionate biosynthesis protein SbnA n=1 Tax=Nocardia sp. NPDC051570 TaxID=3364324 RepID=UPI003793E755